MKSLRIVAGSIVATAWLVVGTWPANVLADAIHAPNNYELSRVDRKAVEASACMTPHGLKLDRAFAYDFRGETYASARCKSHGVVEGQRMHYRVTCAREAPSWKCFNTVEYLRARVGKRELYLVAPRENMRDALGATKYLIETGKFEPGSMSDPVSLNHRSIYHVHAEAAGERIVKIQNHPTWLYVEAVDVDGGTRYREVEAGASGNR